MGQKQHRCPECGAQLIIEYEQKLQTYMKVVKDAPKEMPSQEDLVFGCNKCGHQVYTDDAKKMIDYECPNCGEEPYENWFLVGRGNYEKDHGGKDNGEQKHSSAEPAND